MPGAVVIVVLALGTWLEQENSGLPSTTPVLAVLPFDDFSGDTAQAYLAFGMTDALISSLGSIRGLDLISRTSVMAFRDERPPLPQIAQALNADLILEGSLLRVGDLVRINTQLTRAATGLSLWSGAFEGDLPNVLGLLAEVARTVAEQVEVVLTPRDQERLSVAPSSSSQVVDAVMRARYLVDRQTPDDLQQALRILEAALDLDPAFAPAWGLLAGAHMARGFWWGGSEPVEEIRPPAEQAARRALALDPENTDAQRVMAAIHTVDGRWRDAVDVYQKALDRDPSQAWGHIELANILTAMGRWEEAEATARDGLKVAPLLPDAHNEVMNVLSNSRRRDESLPFLIRSLELDPGHVNTRFLMTVTLAWMGRCQDSREPRLGELGIGGALAEAEYLLNEACPDLPVCVMAAAYAFQRCQRTEDARQLHSQAEALAERGYFSPATLARIRLIMGDREGALEALEAALEVRDPSLRFVTNGTWNRTLRGDPRFEAIVDRLGLPREKDWSAADPMGIEPSTRAMEEPQSFPGS